MKSCLVIISRIIAITADATEEAISQIKSSGFDDFLIKPVTRERLLEITIGLRADHDSHLVEPDFKSELETAIVDEEPGIRYASGNKVLWQWSLKTLAHKLPLYRDALQQTTETHEREELSQILHKIIGAAAYCGATNLLSATKQLQNKIKSDANAEFALEHSPLNTSITAFLDWLTRQKLD